MDLEYGIGALALAVNDLGSAAEAYHRALKLAPLWGGARSALWHGIAGLGRVRQAAGDATKAAHLFGIAATLAEDIPYPYTYLARIEQQRYIQTVNATRAAIGDAAFDAAFEAGKALSLEQAIAEVLAMLIPGAATGSPE